MTTKDYPLDIIKALHLLTGDEPVELETNTGERISRKGEYILLDKTKCTIPYFTNLYGSNSFRIYEPPKPAKLEPVELDWELTSRMTGRDNKDTRDVIGLAIAQAVRMAREEREAEKKGEER